MPYFDLHCHPSFKSGLLNDDVTLCPNPVDSVDIQLNVPFSNCVEKLIGNSLDSQSSFGQIPGGSLVVTSFISFERVYAFVKDLQKIKNLGQHILQNMRDQSESYFQILTKRDIAHFNTFLTIQNNSRHYKLLKSISDYPDNPDLNTVYVVASIEGGHNFYTRKNLIDQENNPLEVVNQLAEWKRQSITQPDTFPRLFYITLAHHGQNVLANHAWAIPIRFAADTVNVGAFDPTGDGLSASGKEFIHVALRQNANEKRILIDVKHLSLASRRQVYELIENDPALANVPILATHMGVVGTSWDTPPIAEEGIRFPTDRPKNCIISYKRIGGFLRNVPVDSTNSGFTRIPFNPWSINLYDEDIIHIMRSKGLIGISLDRRILGATLTSGPTEDERFSRKDIPQNWQDNTSPLSFYPTTPLPNQFSGIQSPATQELWAFCQAIVHIVLVTELAKGNPAGSALHVPADVNPWNHICLGSDFDGLIAAIKKASTADKVDNLFDNEIQNVMTAMINHLNTSPVLANPIEIPNQVADKLRFENGFNFLKTHFV